MRWLPAIQPESSLQQFPDLLNSHRCTETARALSQLRIVQAIVSLARSMCLETIFMIR